MKLDLVGIFRQVFDSTTKSLRMKLQDTEISMELDHADGDSVTSHPHKLVAKVEGVSSEDNGKEIIPAMDCSSLREAKLYVEGSGSAKLMVSPEDSGDFFVEHTSGPLVARRLKVDSTDAEGTVHLVGRS